MFRDLKEYQEIAKIYADKVSKPEDLEERVRGGGVSTSPVKPFEKPSPQVSGNRGNRPEVKGGITFKKPTPSASNKRAEAAKSRREMQNKPSNTDASGKVIPSTAEIRAKAAAKRGGTPAIGGGNAGASTDSGGTSKSTIKSVPVEKEVSTMTKQGKPRTKAQMMAAKRIASGKTISDVKAENQASMKSKAAERFAAFKAKRAEKKAAKMNEDITPYDIVLEYLLSSEQAATIEEANYVMTEMDAETIQGIVEEQKKKLDEVAIVPAVAGIVAAGTLGAMGINAIRKMNKNKEKMDKGETFKKGSTMDNIQKKNQMYKDMGIAK